MSSPAGQGIHWPTLTLLFLAAALNYGDRTAVSSVLPLLQSEFSMSSVELASIGTVFLWSYAAGSPFAGRLADRMPRARLVTWSLAAWSLVMLLNGFVQSTGQFLAVRALLGIAECAYLPAAIALIADWHGPSTRATAMGVHLAGLNFGLIGGGYIAGKLGDMFGWRPSFWVLGCAGLVLAAVSSRMLRDSDTRVTSEAPPPTMPALRALFALPSYRILVLEAMLASVGTWIFFNWLPLYYRETFNMTLAGAGLSGTAILQTAAVMGVLYGGVLSDKAARPGTERRMLWQSVFYLACAPFLLAFLVGPGYAAVSAAIFGFALLRALGQANENPLLCDLLPAGLRSTAIALMNTANCFAGGIGNLVAGYLKEGFGLAGVFAGVSVIMVIAAALLLAGFKLWLRPDLDRRPRAAAAVR